MKAAVFDEFRGRIDIRSVDDPVAQAGGVVIKVEANGVCRSDWHGWMGHDRSIPLPHVPGHEMAGTIVAIDPAVVQFAEGDRVTVPFVLGCGICPQCRAGNQHVCDNQYQPGFSGWGAFAEYVALPYADVNLVSLPDSMEFSTAAGLGCRFATAFRAVVDQGEVSEGSQVAVWGCGGVGLSAIMIASALGATVVAVDIDDEALAMAGACGADFVVNAGDDHGQSDPVKVVRELSAGGVDVSIDALGSTGTAVSSIRSLRTRGRHIQVGLMIGDDAKPVIPMWRLHANEIELYGSHGMQAWRYPAMLEMVADGRLAPNTLVTSTVNLSDGIDHLTNMASFPGTGFVVVDSFDA